MIGGLKRFSFTAVPSTFAKKSCRERVKKGAVVLVERELGRTRISTDKTISVWHFVSYHHPYKRTTAQGSILRCDSDQGNVNGASRGKTLRNRTGRNLRSIQIIFLHFYPRKKNNKNKSVL